MLQYLYFYLDLVNCSRHLAIRSVLTRDGYTEAEPDKGEDELDSGTCEHCAANKPCDRDLHPSVTTGTVAISS